ncbi:MAG: hypothetical protein ACK5A1_05065 [Planctomyces sp.]
MPDEAFCSHATLVTGESATSASIIGLRTPESECPEVVEIRDAVRHALRFTVRTERPTECVVGSSPLTLPIGITIPARAHRQTTDKDFIRISRNEDIPVAHRVIPPAPLRKQDVIRLVGKLRLGVPRHFTPRDVTDEIDGWGWRDCRDFDGTGDSADGWSEIGNKTSANCLVAKIGNLFPSFAGHQTFSNVQWEGFCSRPDIEK